MASIIIRNLEAQLKRKLRLRAARHGSMSNLSDPAPALQDV
jgi:plasmid stability protein